MLPTIKFRSLFLALFVFTASGYGQAEQTMEQTEKWLNDYARNEIRFVGADFGERNRHIDYAFSECTLTGKGQNHQGARRFPHDDAKRVLSTTDGYLMSLIYTEPEHLMSRPDSGCYHPPPEIDSRTDP